MLDIRVVLHYDRPSIFFKNCYDVKQTYRPEKTFNVSHFTHISTE